MVSLVKRAIEVQLNYPALQHSSSERLQKEIGTVLMEYSMWLTTISYSLREDSQLAKSLERQE